MSDARPTQPQRDQSRENVAMQPTLEQIEAKLAKISGYAPLARNKCQRGRKADMRFTHDGIFNFNAFVETSKERPGADRRD